MCVCVCLGNVLFLCLFLVCFCLFFSSLTYRFTFRDYYFVCAIGGQIGICSFGCLALLNFIVEIVFFVCFAEINILLLLPDRNTERAVF